MEREVFGRIRSSLVAKRDNLNTWLATSPTWKKQMRLGARATDEVYSHLDALDDAIDRCDSETLGRCKVCNGYVEPALLEMDYTCCVCLEHLSADETHSLEAELELAGQVQQSLLPQQVPDIPGLDIAAYSRPAQIVGGDYFDFFVFQDGKPGLAIADVAGHGISASLHMASAQTLLRTLVPASTLPAQVVTQIQHLYSHNIHFASFVTLFLMAYDAARNKLIYCNAGHNPPLLVRSSRAGEGEVLWLPPTGAAIGLLEDAEFKEETIALQPEDIIVLYTDGVTEAMNRRSEQYGRENLAALVKQSQELDARDLVAAIRQDLREFVGGQRLTDDTTIIVARFTP
jgi:sigma-B regulation protein RsbU (phosphoserine phosphatase)